MLVGCFRGYSGCNVPDSASRIPWVPDSVARTAAPRTPAPSRQVARLRLRVQENAKPMPIHEACLHLIGRVGLRLERQ